MGTGAGKGHQGSSAASTFPVSWGWDHPVWMCQVGDRVPGAGLDLMVDNVPHAGSSKPPHPS